MEVAILEFENLIKSSDKVISAKSLCIRISKVQDLEHRVRNAASRS